MDQHVDFKNITILDANEDLDSPEHIKAITGQEHTRNIDQYDIIFKSSGIPVSEELIPYQDKIVTQVQLFFDNYHGKVIAVTASKGKSTIVSLIYSLLNNAGYRTKLVGNIGTPVFDEIDFTSEEDFVVIELSSYMLQSLRKKNYISILGTIFPEHLDRHGSFDKYVDAKLNILNDSEINIVYE
jgi:UDP-N-acetylmuramoylalanine--D-glutamate ligase